MTYQNVNIAFDTDVEIEIDADDIVNDASDTVVEIMNDNLDLDNQVATAISEVDLSEAIQGTLKMHPELVIGAIVEYAKKESQQQFTIETLRGDVSAAKCEIERVQRTGDALEAELLVRGARIESLERDAKDRATFNEEGI